MTDLTTTAADTLRTRAAKSLDAMRAAITRADAARSDAAHQARAAHVVDAAQTAATNHRAAADAWEALATHAATQASDCRRGAALADRTRHRWAREASAGPTWRRAAGALRLRGHARLLDHQGALGAGGLTGRRPRRPRLAPGHAWRGTASDEARASSRIHARNARTSGRCRAAAVVIRQQRSGASARRAKSGTSVRLSSSRAISIGRPMAAPSPVTAAWTSTRARPSATHRIRHGIRHTAGRL